MIAGFPQQRTEQSCSSGKSNLFESVLFLDVDLTKSMEVKCTGKRFIPSDPVAALPALLFVPRKLLLRKPGLDGGHSSYKSTVSVPEPSQLYTQIIHRGYSPFVCVSLGSSILAWT
jgi:hypothetical protein